MAATPHPIVPTSLRPSTFAPEMDEFLAWMAIAADEIEATGVAMGVSGTTLGAGIPLWLQTPSSANLRAAMTDETGTGALVFGTSPTLSSPILIAPNLGTPSAATLTNATGLPLTTGVTGALPVTSGGTGNATGTTAYGLQAAGTTATGAHQTLPTGTAGQVLVSGGALALPSWAVLSINSIGAATANATIANAAYNIAWNWKLTGAADNGMKFGETSASTGGSAGGQDIVEISTLVNSTANPLRVNSYGVDNFLISKDGAITITGRSALAVVQPGSSVNITAGDGSQSAPSNPGSVNITSGSNVYNSSGNPSAGPIAITTGAGGPTSGGSGPMSLLSGNSSVAIPGAVTIGTGTYAGTGGSEAKAVFGGTLGGIALTTGTYAGTGGDLTITLGTGVTPGRINYVNCTTPNGAVAVSLGSTGPTGASATPRKWAVEKYDGVVYYRPLF